MSYKRLAAFCVSGVLAALMGSAQVAHAGGCSRQPQPGDYLNCGLNGPYGPSGENYVECRSQCTALKNCLNSRPTPPANCNAQQQALDNCVSAGRSLPSSGPQRGNMLKQGLSVTVAYEAGVGCFLVDSGTTTSRSTDGGRASNSNEYISPICFIDSDYAYEAYESSSSPSRSSSAIKSVISSRLGVSEAQLTSDADFYTDLGASWEDMRAVADDFGKIFSVKIEDEVVNNLNTVDDVINCAHQASLAGLY